MAGALALAPLIPYAVGAAAVGSLLLGGAFWLHHDESVHYQAGAAAAHAQCLSDAAKAVSAEDARQTAIASQVQTDADARQHQADVQATARETALSRALSVAHTMPTATTPCINKDTANALRAIPAPQ